MVATSLGLLCAAAGRLLAQRVALTRERLCTEVANICSGLVERELNGTHATKTSGERIFTAYGLTGATGTTFEQQLLQASST